MVLVWIRSTDVVHLLISENDTVGFMRIDTACLVSPPKSHGYMTIPELRAKGNTFFFDIIATDEMLDFLGYVP